MHLLSIYLTLVVLPLSAATDLTQAIAAAWTPASVNSVQTNSTTNTPNKATHPSSTRKALARYRDIPDYWISTPKQQTPITKLLANEYGMTRTSTSLA